MPRRPSIEEILREEIFALEQQQALEKNPESMANRPDGLSGGNVPSQELMYNREPMTQWGGQYDDQPTAEAMAQAESQRGNAVGREFGPRINRGNRGEMADMPPPPNVGANPNGMRGLAGAYGSLPEGSTTQIDPYMKVMPQVPQQDMQQLMDFYINGGSDV